MGLGLSLGLKLGGGGSYSSAPIVIDNNDETVTLVFRKNRAPTVTDNNDETVTIN